MTFSFIQADRPSPAHADCRLVGFTAAVLYQREADTGCSLFLYGLVGLAPAMLSSWLSHKYANEPQRMAKA